MNIIYKKKEILRNGKTIGHEFIPMQRQNKNGIKGAHKSKYLTYMNRAMKKEIAFELTEIEFFDICKRDCTYCGQPYSNGIDRINSKEGYTLRNSQSCCYGCNMMKYTQSHNEFLERILKIAKHLELS